LKGPTLCFIQATEDAASINPSFWALAPEDSGSSRTQCDRNASEKQTIENTIGVLKQIEEAVIKQKDYEVALKYCLFQNACLWTILTKHM
jgi:hypothetical protein